MKKFFLLVLLFFVEMTSYAQQKDALFDEVTALKKEVLQKDVTVEAATLKIQAYLKKAKKSNRKELIGRAYYLLSLKNLGSEKQLAYLDSTLFYTEQLQDDPMFPMKPYVYKGSYLFNQNQYDKALDNYILAENLAKSNGNIAYQYHVKFNIANLKRRIGKYEEAVKLFKECMAHEESKQQMNVSRYINTLFQLSSVYCQTKQTAECTEMNIQGIQLATQHKSFLYHNFVVNEGINLSIKGNYAAAVDSIEKGIPHLRERHQVISYLYLAKSYDALNKKEKALQYFKKIDTSFIKTESLFPPLLEAYEYLIKDAEAKNDLRSELNYTKQLIKAGKVVMRDYKYLSNTIGKEYDFPQYVVKRDELIEELQNDKKLIITISILLIVLVSGGLLYNYRLKKQYQKRYEAIIQKSNSIVEDNITVKDVKYPVANLDVDEQIVQDILQELHLFEEEHHFLQNQITLNEVAKRVNTNSKYLSKVINTYKNKNFRTYINDLRVDYLVQRMQHDPMYRKYTLRAIAEEGGFSNPESFFRAFQKRTGLKPSYFIKKVREDQQKIQ
jgi:AraC-like DNA-binding protein